MVSSAAEAGEQVDDLASGQVGPQGHVTGDVRHVPVRFDGLGPGIDAENPHRSGCGPDQAKDDP